MTPTSLRGRLSSALSSPRTTQKVLSLWLAAIVVWLVPLVFLAPHGESVRHAAQVNLVFATLYALILTAAVLCMLRRLPALTRRVSVGPPERGRLSRTPAVVRGPFDPARAHRALRAAGYRRITVTEDRAWGVRNAFSPLGTLLLHASLLLVVIGGLASLLPGADFVGRTRLDVGERFNGNAAEYFEVGHGSAPSEQRPGPAFQVERISGRAPGDAPPLDLSAVLVRRGGRKVDLSAGLPWIPNPATTVAVEDFGMTPRLSIIPSGAVLPSARAAPKLALSRSGVDEYAEVSLIPYARYRLGVRMIAGADSAPAERPAVIVSVARRQSDGTWRLEAEPATLTVGAKRKFGEVLVRLDSVDPNAVFRVSQSPATPFIGLAVVLAAAGPILRLLLPRREALVTSERRGKVSISVAVDAFRPSPSVLSRLVRAWERAAS